MSATPIHANPARSPARRSLARRLLGGAVLPLLGLALGCGEAPIETYRAPKGAVTEAAPREARANAGRAEGGSSEKQAPRPAWQVPDGWQRVNSDSRMRRATYEAGGENQPRLEIAVTALSGRAGGLRANVNRWRRQIGLEPLSEKAIDQALPRFEAGEHEGYLVDMVGDEERVVGAVLPTGGRTWFVKARAAPKALEPHVDAIRAFARSFRPRENASTERARPSETRQQQSAGAPSGGSAPPKADWEKPNAWDAAEQDARFAAATFVARRGERSARVTVTPLPGDGGGALQNINRWRRQVGLEPVESLQQQPVTRLDEEGPRGAIVDLAAEGDAADRKRMLVAMLIAPEHTWFVKMRGPSALLRAERERFHRFVESVRFEETTSNEETSTP